MVIKGGIDEIIADIYIGYIYETQEIAERVDIDNALSGLKAANFYFDDSGENN